MECKKLGRETKAGPWLASATECKRLGSVLMSRWKIMFVSGFAFAFLVCSIVLAFSYPGKMAINPILIQRQIWLHSMFTGRSPNSSVSFLSFIFTNSNSTSSAKLNHGGSFPSGESSQKMPGGDEPGAALKENSVGGMKSRAKSWKKGAPRGRQKVQGSNENSMTAHGLKNTNIVTGIFNSTGTGTGSIPDIAQKLVSFKNGTNEASTGPSPKEPKPKVSEKAARECNIFHGRWVHDESYPYYPPGSCPSIDESFNCFRNMRPDNEYEKWRWQPNDCNIPRLNASDMLERLRGKRLVFVGDSLNRNMWESLVCILRHGVADKKRVREISGRSEFKTDGFYAFRYEDYNCSVEFVRAPFLVEEWEMPAGNGTTKETLRLDLIQSFAPKYRDADVLVFNTGHWWSHEKTSLGKDYYQEGDRVYPELNVLEAFRKALRTWGRWLDSNIDPTKTLVFFRGYSASHFSGGQWNSGGQCHKESQPIFNDAYLTKYPPKMEVLESVIKEIKTPVIYLNITKLSDYRKDGHPSIYRKQHPSEEERRAPEKYQDCSHWCLPGVPDTWNELLYAALLGVWGE